MSQLDADGPGLRDDRPFGSGVDCMFRGTRDPVDGGDVANRSLPFASDYVCSEFLHEKKLGAHVHMVELLKLSGRVFQKGAVEANPGIIHQTIQSTEGLESLLGEFQGLPEVA